MLWKNKKGLHYKRMTKNANDRYYQRKKKRT